MHVEPWCVDSVEITDNDITVGGWAIAPGGDPATVTFTINDREFEDVRYQIPRADIGGIFSFRPHAQQSGFTCRTRRTKDEVFENGRAVFRLINKETRRPIREAHNYYYYDATKDDLILPDAPTRRRVHGGEDESAFRLEGFSTFIKLQQTLQQLVGKDYGDFDSVLDWGCGCGRMTRYFRGMQRPAITGVDVVGDSVEWCRRNLPFGSFETIPLSPPTPLPPSSFDLLIGISVFTHLRQANQLEWLAELHRLARPGAILLMTVHGDATVCRANLPLPLLIEYMKEGFVDVRGNTDLEAAGVSREYYRNVLQTRDHVFRTWSRYFTIVDIVQGYIGNHQDLVVMRKP
jgi:SAM-dependent methyltransferase